MTKKETTTAAIAPFQHKMGFGMIKRPTCIPAKAWHGGQKHCKRWKENGSCPSCDRIEETADRANSRIGAWTFAEPEPYDHPLNDKVGGDSEKSPKASDHYEIDDDPEGRVRRANKLVSDRNKEANAGKAKRNRHDHRGEDADSRSDSGGPDDGGDDSWGHDSSDNDDTKKGKVDERGYSGALDDPYWEAVDAGVNATRGFHKKVGDFLNIMDFSKRTVVDVAKQLAKAYGLDFQVNKMGDEWRASLWLTEATVSGQALGSPSTGAVAGTDTRFGGPTFEPNFFEQSKPENNVIRNEKTFYKKTNDAVLLNGFEYVSDYAERIDSERIKKRGSLSSFRFSDDEIESNEIGDEVSTLDLDRWDGEDADSGIDRKEKTGVAWELDGPQSNYRKLLQRLRKEHNI